MKSYSKNYEKRKNINSNKEILNKINEIELDVNNIFNKFKVIIPNLNKIKKKITNKNVNENSSENNHILEYLNDFNLNLKKDLDCYKTTFKEEILKEINQNQENLDEKIKKLVKQELELQQSKEKQVMKPKKKLLNTVKKVTNKNRMVRKLRKP